MPKNKDLKRLARARMEKTGESYTTARAQLLAKRQRRTALTPARCAELAGMTNEAVEKKTGCDWPSWVWHLDRVNAASMSHREIAAHVHERFEISGWWAQTVTVGYERIKGLRELGQRRDGTYDANKSKTFPVPIGRLYRACRDVRQRRKWLDAELEVRKATKEKSMRVTWEDGTPVDLYFWAKGDAKSQLQLQHGRLPSRAAADEMKAFWGERFAALGEALLP